jgi:diguanylate cyclase (GGDEF)-like protein
LIHVRPATATSIPSPASLLAIQIVQAAVRPSITVPELVSLCQNDPAFVARLLQHCNSATLGLNRRVTGVQHAVSLLGVRGVRNLALTTCVTEMAPIGENGDWVLALCLRRAIAAKMIAQKLAKADLDDYFTIGMLLEIALVNRAKDEAGMAVARAPANTRVMLDRSASQEDHVARGARMARSFHLDPELVGAIACHHDREPPSSQLGAVAWLAERVAGVFEGGDVSKNRVDAIEGGTKLGLKPQVVDELLAAIPNQVREVSIELKRDVGPQVNLDLLLRDAHACLIEVNRSYVDLIHRLEGMVREKEQMATELQQATDQLKTLALTDSLTGCGNRRAFEDALKRDLARADRQGTPLSLILIDADMFKDVNDTHGHQVGDAVLQMIAETLAECVRASDVVARVGGEEFALLLPNTPSEGAMVVAERARASIARKRVAGSNNREVRVSVSLGVATVQGPRCRGMERALFDAADRALYAAKQQGRNRTLTGVL